MRRFRVILAAAVAVALLGIGAWRSGSVRGATAAVIDHTRGHPAFYSLGCTNNWPRDRRDFRTRELLNRDYHIGFFTIGGYAPSDFAYHFVTAYDWVSYRLLRLRFGKKFDEEVVRLAAADVYDHEILLEGCYWPSQDLVTAAGDIVRIAGADLAAAQHKTVRVRGTLLDIKGSEWRRWGYPEVRAANVEILGAPCGRR